MIYADVDVAELRRTFEEFSPALREALGLHILAFAERVRSWAATHYMTGSPLKQRSGNLIRSLHVAPLEETEHEVSTAVGTNLVYGRVHELGGTFQVRAHKRLLTMVFGRPVPHREIEVRAHSATYPRRAFLAPSLQDNEGAFQDEMDAAVREAWEAARGAA